MKEDKENIDEFFKEYFDSLPESNFSDEMEQKLKNSIFEKVIENRTRKVENNFSRIINLVYGKKYVYPKLAAASILLAISFYFIFRSEYKSEIQYDFTVVKPDTTDQQIKKDSMLLQPIIKIPDFEEIQFASLNYDLTFRSLDDADNVNEKKVISIINDELSVQNLQYSIKNEIIKTEEFNYNNKISYLNIIVNKNSKEINFRLLFRIATETDKDLKKINPKIIINQIESKILSLVEIE